MKLFGIQQNRRTFIRWKIYVDRARMYIGYISFVMIAFMFLNDFKDETIRTFLDENKLITYPVMMVLFMVFSLILGRLDTKLGLRKEEMRNAASENPVTMEILQNIKEIKQKLNDKR
ncbi:hypothetical protein SAMN05444285_103127 [Draconibacterium orientale]|uniref:Uncharacterized protein n=1 Tax=Draconibacterium orientale TaxID=1168034 RepID=X5D9T4_9BACT|nr:hypothetical protein [Draconibacterium orientale]AHW59543.1 hypothetical protein FH5T_07900 [Draconibacterium orientale]SES91872.1 hypothetical protein SAMN05444285_103127 [Draconibacterium orientale]